MHETTRCCSFRMVVVYLVIMGEKTTPALIMFKIKLVVVGSKSAKNTNCAGELLRMESWVGGTKFLSLRRSFRGVWLLYYSAMERLHASYPSSAAAFTSPLVIPPGCGLQYARGHPRENLLRSRVFYSTF